MRRAERCDQTENTRRHARPRTAVGLSKDGKTLILVAIDGRRAELSLGMTWTELGQFMLDQGAWNALCMDGGGSTTMVGRNEETGAYAVLNTPSDGWDLPVPLSIERPVLDVIGVKIDDASRP
ncbi:MAG: phosphodiester glycosidase family protein [Tepidisphaeraceae bacterium]